MRIDVRGLAFDVATGGPDGGRPVLLLHGFPQRAAMWDLLLPALHAAGMRTIAPDQRGYSPGARPAEVSAYRLHECVADAVAILDALGAPTADLVGHDWGAVVAWELAARCPERVRTLTAVSVPHPAAFATAIATDADQRERSSYIGLFRRAGRAEQVLLGDDAAALRAMFAGCPPQRVDRYVTPMRGPGALTAALNWYRAQEIGELTTVGPVAIPTTYVYGTDDIAVGERAATACADHVTGDYRLVRLATSHWVPDAAPHALAGALLHRITAPGV